MVTRMQGSSNWNAVKKTVCSVCHTPLKTYYDREIKRTRDLSSGSFRIYVEFEYRRVFCKKCNAVKVETLSWLASNTRYTKRYERHIGRLCRELTVKRVAELERLSWYQVRQIEINYMNELVNHFGKITRLRAIRNRRNLYP